MQALLSGLFGIVAYIHSYIMTLNDGMENSFTDKELHFIVIGVLGIAMVLVLHPIFLWLSRTGHTMVISFFYVITVIIVITFAIEIGQGITGTGNMEFDDITYGICGFMVFFAIFLIVRAIVHLIMRLVKRGKEKDDYYY